MLQLTALTFALQLSFSQVSNADVPQAACLLAHGGERCALGVTCLCTSWLVMARGAVRYLICVRVMGALLSDGVLVREGRDARAAVAH